MLGCKKFWEKILDKKNFGSKIDDISRVLAGVDDDFDIPDWG